MSNTEEVMIIQ